MVLLNHHSTINIIFLQIKFITSEINLHKVVRFKHLSKILLILDLHLHRENIYFLQEPTNQKQKIATQIKYTNLK